MEYDNVQTEDLPQRHTGSARVSGANRARKTMFGISANSRQLALGGLAPERTARSRWFSVLLCRFTTFASWTRIDKLCRVELIKYKDTTIGGSEY
jgi:hypothetical protein